ncbi:MAG: hypothetical protein LBS37_09955 [Treponema sp.]|nr:hypothetical protein [Treponema sp.]
MRIVAIGFSRQGSLRPGRTVFYWALWVMVYAALVSCGGKKEETPIVPPLTSPLSRTVIGFGVINVSYTYVTAEPEDGGASLAYLRRGSLVRIIERRLVKNGGSAESWVLAEGSGRGWLREELVDIYDNEGKAKTASESMSR